MADVDFRIKNGLIVNNSLIYATGGKVGIANTAPSNTLHVTGTAYVSGDLTVGGTTNFSGPTTLTGAVNVSSISTTSFANVSGTLRVSGAANLLSTVGITGAATLSNTLAVTGATTLSNTLVVTGAANTLSTLGVGGAANLFSTLGVVGATTLSNTLAVTGAVSLSNNLTMTLGSTTTLGYSTFSNVATFSAVVNMNSTLNTASLGVGTAASGTTGEIRATNDITAFYSSDQRLKENVTPISNPLDKLMQIRGVEFDWTQDYINDHGGEDGYFVRKHDIGVIAQEIEKILPEVVGTRPDGIKAVKYERIIPLLIECIKELNKKLESK